MKRISFGPFKKFSLLCGIEVYLSKELHGRLFSFFFHLFHFQFYFIFRQITGNGTLYFPPFLGQYFRADVHEGIYRCKASNQAGTVLSRDVDIRAGKNCIFITKTIFFNLF